MRNKLLSIVLTLTLCLSLVACKESTSTEPVTENADESPSDSYQYNITALLSEDNSYNQILLEGFTDALSDYIGDEHFTITTASVSEDTTSEMLATDAIKASPDMIFTAGKSTLLAASDATDSIPIISTGIVDFKGTLHIASLGGSTWDKTTGRNITGISSKPSIVDQVSLMIEATEDLQTVGIFFSPEDTDAIYQNEIFEAYLDQAGIPWKEYLIPVEETTITESVPQNSTALTPSKYVAASAKQGMDNDVEALGEDSLVGLNSPSSTRVALVSDFWSGGKKVAKKATDETDSNNEDTDSDISSEDEKDITEITLEDRITEACNECSAIYIPFGSLLTDQMDTIGTIAQESDVVIVAGDSEIGENALVTLFSDPYSYGYAAGKKAVRVFNGDDISTIKIGYGSSDDSVKLYNGTIVEAFGIEFPKSFSELNEFLSTYEYGSNTVRYSIAGE
ncbi:MAG: hypothetical protein E7273_00245 [Pseudobutyrivibrio ruminis]|nr:hypothetical protein [Pseudobutyrivibrio ruminis]